MILSEDTLNELAFIDDMKAMVARTVSGATKDSIERSIASLDKRSKEAETALTRAGVKVERARAVATKEAERILAKYGSLSETVMVAGSPSFQALATDVQAGLLKTFMTMYDDMQDSRDVEAGLLLFMVVIAVNTFASILMMGLIGSMAGMAFTAVVVAPVVEEMARRRAIEKGYGLSTFTFAINVFEFTQYTAMMLKMGVSLGVAVTIRATLAVFHQFLGALQKWGYVRDVRDGVPPADAGKTELYMAIILHAINNAFGSLFWKMVFPGTFGETSSSQLPEEILIELGV